MKKLINLGVLLFCGLVGTASFSDTEKVSSCPNMMICDNSNCKPRNSEWRLSHIVEGTYFLKDNSLTTTDTEISDPQHTTVHSGWLECKYIDGSKTIIVTGDYKSWDNVLLPAGWELKHTESHKNTKRSEYYCTRSEGCILYKK